MHIRVFQTGSFRLQASSGRNALCALHMRARSLLCLLLSVFCLSQTLTGCVNHTNDHTKAVKQAEERVTSQNLANVTQPDADLEDGVPVSSLTDIETLSPNAKSIYVFLLCDQAFRTEDEAALLEALPLLEELRMSPQIWMEAGLWLMSRKSGNTGYFMTRARSAWPEDTSLLILQAEALRNDNRTEEAIGLIRSFLQTSPDSQDARLELAMLLVQHKDFSEAEELLKTVSGKEHSSPMVNFQHGKALMGLQKHEKAIPYFLKATRDLPDFADAYIELGLCYEHLKRYDQAIRAYENVLKTDFPSKNILLHLINLSLRLKRPEKALRYMELGPNDIPFKLVCADMFLDSRHYLQATNILKPLTERNDTPVEVYLLLADLTWEHMRDLKGALKWLDTMPASYQKSGQVILLRTQLYARANNKDQALLQARLGKSMFPEETKFWEAEARILTMQDRIQEALRVMEEAVRKWPNDMHMLFLMGNILDESGDKSAALRLMEQIIEREPDNFQALNYIGYTLADGNREIDRAVALLERAIKIAPDRAYIVDSLAWAYFRAGRKDDALREIRRCVTLDANPDPAIWEHYGDIAQSAGLKQEARDAYTKAMELEPKNTESLKKKMATP